MEVSKCGTWGWLGLAAGVAAWDLYMPETLSSAVDRALDHKQGKYLAIGAVAVTAAHLLNVFEELGLERFDLIHQIGSVIKKN